MSNLSIKEHNSKKKKKKKKVPFVIKYKIILCFTQFDIHQK